MINLNIMILLLIMTSSTMAQLNTLRENQLLFSSGIKIEDTVEDNLGDSIPINVCNQSQNSPKCTQRYSTYWVNFEPQGATVGTINITLTTKEGEEDEDFKIMGSGAYEGDTKLQALDHLGFNKAYFCNSETNCGQTKNN